MLQSSSLGGFVFLIIPAFRRPIHTSYSQNEQRLRRQRLRTNPPPLSKNPVILNTTMRTLAKVRGRKLTRGGTCEGNKRL